MAPRGAAVTYTARHDAKRGLLHVGTGPGTSPGPGSAPARAYILAEDERYPASGLSSVGYPAVLGPECADIV